MDKLHISWGSSQQSVDYKSDALLLDLAGQANNCHVYIITEVCVYKGTMYTQGQKWQDGCQFECVCDDAMTGHYHCTDRWHNSSNISFICI